MDNYQPSSVGSARTKLDLLYYEVLGEITSIVDKLESTGNILSEAQKNIQSITDNQLILPQQLSRHLSETITATTKPLNHQSEQAIQNILDKTNLKLEILANESANFAKIASISAKHMVLIALAIGGCAGVIGGILAGLVIGQWLVI